MTIRKTSSVAAIKVNTALAHVHAGAGPNVIVIASPSRRTSLLQRQVSRALEIIDLYDHDDADTSANALAIASPRVQLETLSARTTNAVTLNARKSLGVPAKTAVFQISPAKRKRSASLSSNAGNNAAGLDVVDDLRLSLDIMDSVAATRSHRAKSGKPRDGSARTALQSKRCSSKDKKKKRLKVDVVERALKRFHASRCLVDMDERCFDFTTMGHLVAGKPQDTADEEMASQKSNGNNRSRSRLESICSDVTAATVTPLRVQVGVAAAQGTRAYMEDRFAVTTHLFEDRVDEELPRDASLFAIYDGHNGIIAAELAMDRVREMLEEQDFLLGLCRRPLAAASLSEADVKEIETILTEIMARVDQEVLEETQRQHRRDGCTVLVGLLVLGKLFVANLGDSRGVMGAVEGTSADRVSLDHKPNLPEEAARIESMGGKVMFSGCWRVAHDGVPLRLAVSRSLGDHPLKTNLPASCTGPLVSVVPSIRVVDVDGMDDSLVVFASDGLWDRLSDDDAMRIARSRVTSQDKPRGAENSMYDAAHALIDAALRKRSMDNITAMVIRISHASKSKTLVEPDEEAYASEDALSEDDTSMMEL